MSKKPAKKLPNQFQAFFISPPLALLIPALLASYIVMMTKIETFSSGEDYFGLLYYFTTLYIIGLVISFASAIFLFLPQHYALQFFGLTHYAFYLITGLVTGYLLQLLIHEDLYKILWQFRYLAVLNFLLLAIIFRYQAAKP